MLEGHILLTGATGYLGRALIATAEREGWPCSFTAVARSQDRLESLKAKHPNRVRIWAQDVRNPDTMRIAALGHDMLIHLATAGMYGTGEENPTDAWSINVGSAVSLLAAAREGGIRKALFMSADKAVQPVSVYGMTKGIVERLVGEAAHNWGGPDFCPLALRLGNTVGATNSVVPYWLRLARRGNSLPITDPNATRFWAKLDDVIKFISDVAGWHDAMPGSVITGPVKVASVLEMAQAVIEHSGAGGSVGELGTEIVGHRPGDRPVETLIHESEPFKAKPTYHVQGGYQQWVLAPVNSKHHFGPLYVEPPTVRSDPDRGPMKASHEDLVAMVAAGEEA